MLHARWDFPCFFEEQPLSGHSSIAFVCHPLGDEGDYFSGNTGIYWAHRTLVQPTLYSVRALFWDWFQLDLNGDYPVVIVNIVLTNSSCNCQSGTYTPLKVYGVPRFESTMFSFANASSRTRLLSFVLAATPFKNPRIQILCRIIAPDHVAFKTRAISVCSLSTSAEMGGAKHLSFLGSSNEANFISQIGEFWICFHPPQNISPLPYSLTRLITSHYRL